MKYSINLNWFIALALCIILSFVNAPIYIKLLAWIILFRT